MTRWLTSFLTFSVKLTNWRPSLRLESLEDRALPSADPLTTLPEPLSLSEPAADAAPAPANAGEPNAVAPDAPDTVVVTGSATTETPTTGGQIPAAAVPDEPIVVGGVDVSGPVRADVAPSADEDPVEVSEEFDYVWVEVWAVWPDEQSEPEAAASDEGAADASDSQHEIVLPDEGSAGSEDETPTDPGTDGPEHAGPPAPTPPVPGGDLSGTDAIDLVLVRPDPKKQLLAEKSGLEEQLEIAKLLRQRAVTPLAREQADARIEKLTKDLAEVERKLKLAENPNLSAADLAALVPPRPGRPTLLIRPKYDPFADLNTLLPPGRGLPLPPPAPAPTPGAPAGPDDLLRDFTDAVSIAGIIDPTGVLSLGEAGLEAFQGNWGDAGFAMLGAIPIGGKFVKVARKGDKVIDALKAGDKAGDVGNAGAKVDNGIVQTAPNRAARSTAEAELRREAELQQRILADRLHELGLSDVGGAAGKGATELPAAARADPTAVELWNRLQELRRQIADLRRNAP